MQPLSTDAQALLEAIALIGSIPPRDQTLRGELVDGGYVYETRYGLMLTEHGRQFIVHALAKRGPGYLRPA